MYNKKSIDQLYDFTIECLSTSVITRYSLDTIINGIVPHPDDDICNGVNIHYMGKCEAGGFGDPQPEPEPESEPEPCSDDSLVSCNIKIISY